MKQIIAHLLNIVYVCETERTRARGPIREEPRERTVSSDFSVDSKRTWARGAV